MDLKKYLKFDIAKQLLNKAIEIYNGGDNYFAALHVAAAAEEILGTFLIIKGIQTSFQTQKDGFILISKKLFGKDITDKYAADFLNRSKNSIKHMDRNNSNDEFIIMDPKEDARDMIKRAITNWWRLENDVTPEMEALWWS